MKEFPPAPTPVTVFPGSSGMSGVEIAGLILGSFPITLSCLEHYCAGFEPLVEWWNFRTRFIAFVDDVEHQMMKYNENMIRLLDQIIPDSASLTTLILNNKDPRWTDGNLVTPLEQVNMVDSSESSRRWSM